jgi:hypothetical protein
MSGKAEDTAHLTAMRGLLRSVAGPRGWLISRDPEGYPIVRGRTRHGITAQIEPHCDGMDCHGCPLPGPLLAVWTNRTMLFHRLLAIAGVRRWQMGDREMRALFPSQAVDDIAAVIRPRHRPQPSPEVVAASAERLQAWRRQSLEAVRP